MKALKTSSLVFLVVLFIGIAGGFTTTEYGVWGNEADNCSIPHPNPFMPQDWLKKECNAVGGVWEKGAKSFITVNCKEKQQYCDRETKYNPQSTALFVIAGVIITLVGLEMRKK
jgi:hypothetical protein